MGTLFAARRLTQSGAHTVPGFEDEPVFEAPWQAQAFAMVVALHQNGAFTWDEWAATLSVEIHGPTKRPYYDHWLAALEKIVEQKQLTSASDLRERKVAWHDVATRTPHGQPIKLS